MSIASVACGVPISAEEVTATAVNGGSGTPLAVKVDTAGQSSSFSAGLQPAGLAVTSTPTSIAAGTATITATVTGTPAPAGSGTPTAVVGAAGTATATAPPAATPTPVSPAALAAEALQMLNQVRTNAGRTALNPNSALTAAASKYARYMAEQNFFGHDGPDGSSSQGRIVAAGYAGRFRGEALAAGQPSTSGALAVWLNSPAHVVIVLDASAVDVGIGYFYSGSSYYGHYWVLITGIP